ncbi:hypothetical protein TREMEDRAFT_59162 [Tremella mesenterica DSM 1558]|uniref:uncharacterized protein n=1 Tax=Tremella mesenterica (strain ATCC 24925 / CBS 8224 / DSM 1558 / NBRC 9311 / NRRL Y-6157 / RJB 2259-6 / UBC 559-6) TaxID=578456 RepID=UPI0003F49D3F|nr:uncharacterized protein TREMEDRAFT_59162 [Tremella mesenterica DSM 1558]EIW73003.1 hypothetical protein TREMEDRAFT_59162 [Tremella mesenterica DSM 1558]
METNMGNDEAFEDYLRRAGPGCFATMDSVKRRLAACAGAYGSLFRLQLYFSQPPDTRKFTWSQPSMDVLYTALIQSRLSRFLLDKPVPTGITIDGDYDAGNNIFFGRGQSPLLTDMKKVSDNSGLLDIIMHIAKNREIQSSELAQPSGDVARMQAAERVASYVFLYSKDAPDEWPDDTRAMIHVANTHRTLATSIRIQLEA